VIALTTLAYVSLAVISTEQHLTLHYRHLSMGTSSPRMAFRRACTARCTASHGTLHTPRTPANTAAATITPCRTRTATRCRTRLRNRRMGPAAFGETVLALLPILTGLETGVLEYFAFEISHRFYNSLGGGSSDSHRFAYGIWLAVGSRHLHGGSNCNWKLVGGYR